MNLKEITDPIDCSASALLEMMRKYPAILAAALAELDEACK